MAEDIGELYETMKARLDGVDLALYGRAFTGIPLRCIMMNTCGWTARSSRMTTGFWAIPA